MEDELEKVERRIQKAEADLERAQERGNEALELEINCRLILLLQEKERLTTGNSNRLDRFFQFSCHIIRGRTRRKFRANLFRLAEIYSGCVRENTPTDGITKNGKNIVISLIFKEERDLNRFQSEVIELISVFSGHKRPLIDADDTLHPHEVILTNQRTEPINIAEKFLKRVFKHFYDYDLTGNDPDNSAECDGYSDVASLPSAFAEYTNITDPEVCVQMIEDPRSKYWESISLEAAHIKDKVKCTKNDKNDPNNFIYMSRFLHCYFDALNAKPSKFPSMKIQYVRHDEEMIPCPVSVGDPRPLGLPPRQRVIVRIIFWSADVRQYAMALIRGGGVSIGADAYEIDLYFKDAIKAMAFLKWKEEQTEKAWAARRHGVTAPEFAAAEGIGQIDQEEEEEEDRDK